jgi:hypothetical protein
MAYGLPAEPPSADVSAQIHPSWTAWEPSTRPYGTVRGELRNNLDVAFPEAYVSHQLPGQSQLLAELAVAGLTTGAVVNDSLYSCGAVSEAR